jgi:parallel beta-helix repeat protein
MICGRCSLRTLRRARADRRPTGSRVGSLLLRCATMVALVIALCGPSHGVGAAADPRPTLNARDFRTIQDAINHLPDSGGAVVVEAGVFSVREKIKLPSHVELRGAGMDRTTLVLADGAMDHLISNADLSGGNTDITIRDLSLRGNRLGQRRWGYDNRLPSPPPDEVWSFGVRLVNVTDSLIERVDASDFTKDGFYLGYNGSNGVYRTRLLDCRADRNGRNGISLTHGSYNLIAGCEVRDNNIVEQVGGIQLEPDEDLEVSHNVLVGNTASGNHVGIALYTVPPSWRGAPALVANAVCDNRAADNQFVGFWDHYGQGNVFVGDESTGSQNDYGYAETTRVGPEDADACVPPDLGVRGIGSP